MPICKKCGTKFPNYLNINGKRRSLNKREYCVECSPFGLHNTRNPEGLKHRFHCKCGETNPDKFYKNKHKRCGICHNRDIKEMGKRRKDYVLLKLGNKCKICGFDKFESAFDVHHLDPSKKEATMRTMRGWSFGKIDKEISNCALLCSNCHRGVHSGDVLLGA